MNPVHVFELTFPETQLLNEKHCPQISNRRNFTCIYPHNMYIHILRYTYYIVLVNIHNITYID